MSREFDFSRLLAGYSGIASMPKRLSPGVVIAAVDVFAVVVGLAAMHMSGLMWTGTGPAPAAPSLISPVSAGEQAATVPDPHLRPIVAAVHLPATPDATVVFATPVVTDAAFGGGSTFTPGASSSSSTPQQVASADPAPVVTDPGVDPTPQPSAPPVAKLAEIAVDGHVAQRQLTVAASAGATLDDLLLSRGAGNAAGDGNGGSAVAVNASVGGSPAVSVGASANVEVASAAPVVHSVAAPVVSTVSNTVGGVVGAVRGLLN